jgi:hypothetical protein
MVNINLATKAVRLHGYGQFEIATIKTKEGLIFKRP